MEPNIRINRITGLEIDRGGTKILHRHTHTQTHRHTHTDTHTHRHTHTQTDTHTDTHTYTHTDTHTPAAHFISFFFKKETRLKINTQI